MPKAQRRFFKLGVVGRPAQPNWANYMGERPKPLERIQIVPLELIYQMVDECNAVSKSVQAIRDYIFKEGYKWEPLYSRRCKTCKKQYPKDAEPEFCKRCGAGRQPTYPTTDPLNAASGAGGPPPPAGTVPSSGEGFPLQRAATDGPWLGGWVGKAPPPPLTLQGGQGESTETGNSMFPGETGQPSPLDGENWYEEPDDSETERADEFFDCVDRNGHSLVEVLKMFEDHLNIADDGFLVVLQDFDLNKEGDIVRSHVKELFVADPRNFRMVVDPQTMLPGGRYWICLKHRPASRARYLSLHTDQWIDKDAANYAPRERPGRCDISTPKGPCGLKLHNVWYVATEPGNTEAVVEYYVGREGKFPGEVIHCNKYRSSYNYGKPPMVSIWNMVGTITDMERYGRTFYKEERTPRSAIFIPTRNANSVQVAWKAAEDKNVSQGGHYVPKFTYDPGEGGRAPVQYIEFSKLPEELRMLDTHDYYTRRAASAFGVSPVFHGNVDSVGLQSAGPTQWQVMSEAAELGQDVYNTKVFKQLCCLMGLSNFKLVLNEVQEEDEMQKWQVKTMEAGYAQQMQMLGFGPTHIDTEGHFVFPKMPQSIPGMGMMGLGGPPPPPGSEPPPEEEM